MNLNNRSGITLLELLIALSLSIVLLIILFSAMRLGYKSQESGTEKSEITQKIRIIGDRISWLIRGTYPLIMKNGEDRVEHRLFFLGESERIGFVTTSVDHYGNGPEDMAGLKWVSIFLDFEGLSIREKVFFAEDVFEDTDGKIYILEPEATELEFEYLDIPEEGEQGEWVSEWDPDNKNYLPSAVKANLTFEHNGKPVVMPELIVKINTQTKEYFSKTK